VIRTAVNSYYSKVDSLPSCKMYDAELQRDMARECVLEVDGVLTAWRTWRKSKV
jgi:hypothetical protein